ncbi:MAG: hypothetical protein CBC48_05950 [bacterium TMED88]|nr:hypothetical protein [Deltaproteobacteria bacterium]OUV34414.1 MAG: hypothetical protein CBC48_05950 [bacterium TMED88]
MKNGPGNELEQLISAGWRLIALETFEEDRGLRLLDRVGEATQREPIVWSLASGRSGAEDTAGSLEAGLRSLAQHEKPALFVLLDVQPLIDHPVCVRLIRDWLPTLTRRRQTIVMLGPLLEPPKELERETGRVALPLPKQSELDGLFRRVLADDPEAVFTEDDFEACTRAALGLTAGEAVRVLRRSRAASSGLSPETAHAIAGAKREALRRTPALQFYEPGEGLDGIGGLDDLKAWLRERRRAFSTEARQFGLPQPRGLLLLGVQGCGKSLAAKSVSVEWQFPLLRLDLAAVFSNAQHSPEETIRQATAIAESIAPAVLWIDEIEKGFSASQSDPSANRVLGSFLTWMAEKTASVFVVATANDVSHLPPELLRRGRFDELFFVDLPNLDERMSIISIHLERYGRDPQQFLIESLAEESERLSGAELEQAVQAGLYTAFSEQRELEPKDLLNAIHETVPLYETYEDRIKELRDWARQRARPAASDLKMVDLFRTRA